VLGKPIAHSLSPALHNAAYRALNLEGWQYNREEVGQAELEAFLVSLDGSWAGLSLTMPLKKTVMSYGTPCDRWSRELGLANTAVFVGASNPDDGCGAGFATDCPIALYNTDVDGIVLAFRHAWGISHGSAQTRERRTGHKTTQSGSLSAIGGKPVRTVILGNGSTALSALAACVVMAKGASCIETAVVSRRPDANPGIARFGDRHTAIALETLSMQEHDLDIAVKRIVDADIVISTLPAHAADTIARRLSARGGAIASQSALLDVAYDPRPSALQRAWAGAGGMAVGGEEMLLYQAIVQVCLMTGRDAGRWRVAEDDGNGDDANNDAVNDGDIDDVRLEQTMRAALQEAW
jgi:shikimate dehydrogenase